MKTNKVYAVIVAGGQGSRMGMALPKQFLPLNEKPILYYTLAAFIEAIPEVQIILVLPEAHFSYANMVLQHFDTIPEIQIVGGGSTRYESVQNGLEVIEDTNSITLIHDGVRPLISTTLIKRCIEETKKNGNAIPCIPVIDSIRSITHNGSIIVDRAPLRSIQTPQAFKTVDILNAFAQPYQEQFTDEASVIATLGHSIHLIDGERNNIKITTPEDIIIANAILHNQSKTTDD